MSLRLAMVSTSIMLILSLIPSGKAVADTGPKPSMSFEFVQEMPGPALTITSGVLYECEQADCGDAKPLMVAGPQRLSCDKASCSAMAYGFSKYHRLEIQFSDGRTRQSNIFETAGFNSDYKVTIRADDLLVESNLRLPALAPLLVTAACCFALLLLIAGIALLVWYLLKKK